MLTTHDTVALVGLSMGGTLATILAAELEASGQRGASRSVSRDGSSATHRASGGDPEGRVAALVLIAPYFRLPRWVGVIARWHVLVDAVAPYVSAAGGPSILDPAEQARSLAYGATTARLVYELGALARRAWSVLPEVMIPTMILQSHRDNRTTAEIADGALNRIGAADKRLTWVDDGGHVITVDYGRDAVAAAVSDWLARHAPTESRSRMVRPA
jgi:esterase/lipase